MQISKNTAPEGLVFTLEGRLDTNTSPQLQDALLPAIDGSSDVVLDFSAIQYVSSAGLRVLLAAQKAANAKSVSLTLRGVCEDVMEVFEMTGFTDFLTFA